MKMNESKLCCRTLTVLNTSQSQYSYVNKNNIDLNTYLNIKFAIANKMYEYNINFFLL